MTKKGKLGLPGACCGSCNKFHSARIRREVMTRIVPTKPRGVSTPGTHRTSNGQVAQTAIMTGETIMSQGNASPRPINPPPAKAMKTLGEVPGSKMAA